MIIDYNQMKKSREPYFELMENNDVALYIDHLTFIGNRGYERYKKYSLDKVKNIQASMTVLDLSEEDIHLLLDEKFKYEAVGFQFDNMLDSITINKKMIRIQKYEKRFNENQTGK